MKKFKNYFFAGLLVWLPVGLTIWVIHLLLTTVDQIIPEQLSKKLFGVHIPGTGLLIALIILLITGIITKNMLGRRFLQLWDKLILQIPIVKSIYKGIKQVSDTLLSSNGNSFRKALLVKFPHNEAWTIAFITGTPSAKIINNNLDYVAVYVPTTPNPTSGYLIIVKKSDTIELNMSVDEALRYVISMGTINPVSKQVY